MKISYLFILIDLFLVIVGGNVLSITLAGTTIRVGEIFSIVLGVFLLPYLAGWHKNRSVIYIVFWSLLSIVLILVNGFIVYRFSPNEILTAFLYLFRFAYFVLFAFIVARYAKIHHKQIHLLKYLNLLYVIVCLIGFLQLWLYPYANDWYAVFKAIGVNWVGDPHIDRLVSTDFDPNYLASCLLIGIVINLILFNHVLKGKDKSFLTYIKYLLVFCIYALAIFLTKSRSGIVGVAVVAVVYFLYVYDFSKIKIWHMILFLIVICLAGYLVFFSDITVFGRIRNVFTDASAWARFASWGKGFEIILATCFMGIGYNLYPAYNVRFYEAAIGNTVGGMDSSLQLIFVTSGFVGIVLFAMHFINLWKNTGVVFEVKALLVAALVICNFNNLLFYSLWILPFYLLCFLSRGLCEGKEQSFIRERLARVQYRKTKIQ